MNRHICIIALLLLGAVLTGCTTGSNAAKSDVSNLHRLYDFTPVSSANPVVARVKTCGIEIPVSELRGYLEALPDAMPPSDGSKRPPLTLDQKRAQLEKLVGEHFLMWAGYQQKADQTEGISNLLVFTRSMLLRETLMYQEVGARAKTREDYQRRATQLYDRVFDQTKITVSNEAYDELKSTARLLKLTARTPLAATNLSLEPGLEQLTPAVRDHPFARCKIGFVTIGSFLAFYAHMPADRRPDLNKRDGVAEVLKQILEDSLLTEEARARGLEKAPIVLEKLQLNRNKMVRMYALDQIAAESVARMKAPGQETQVRQWYRDHLKDRYTYKDDNGKEQVISFEQQHERIENDYVDDLREQLRMEYIHAMRQDHKIEIDEKALAQAAFSRLQ